MRETNVRVESLIDQSNEGHFSLPAEITKAHAVKRLAAELASAQEDASKIRPEILEASLVDALVTAASEAKKLPNTASAITDAVRSREAASIRVQLVSQAHEIVVGTRNATAQELAATITIEHLRPALEEVIAEATDKARALTGFDHEPDPIELLSAPEPTRQAWLDYQRLGERYRAIRQGQEKLRQLGYRPARDDRFGEFRNFDALWPRRGALGGSSTPPWPTSSGAARLRWIVTGGAEAWMPTAEEADAAYDAFVERNRAGLAQAGVAR